MTLTLSIYSSMIVAVHENSDRKTWDKLGIALSSACLVHCILVFLLPLLVPTLAFFIHTPWMHRFFAAFILIVTPLAFIPGYRRHGMRRVMVQAYLGIGFILLGIFLDGFTSEVFSHGISIVGSIMLVFAHVQNIRHSRHRHCC